MSLQRELHTALLHLDAQLCAARQSIRNLIECCFPESPHSLVALQYRALEEAIEEQQLRAKAVPGEARRSCARTAADVVALGDMSLGIDRWSLHENGWTLAFPGGRHHLKLSTDERSLLLHLARSPEHRISRDELIRLASSAAEAQGAPLAVPETHVRVIHRLRRRVRALGAALPLRASRGGGYRIARVDAATNSNRHAPEAVVRRGVGLPGPPSWASDRDESVTTDSTRALLNVRSPSSMSAPHQGS